jgi:hypothetical protein
MCPGQRWLFGVIDGHALSRIIKSVVDQMWITINQGYALSCTAT